MIRRPPRSTRTYTLFPYTTRFRSRAVAGPEFVGRGKLIEWDFPGHRAAGCSAVMFEEGIAIGTVGERHIQNLGVVERLLRSEEHTSELQSLMRISYAVFSLNITKVRTNHLLNSTHSLIY